MSALLKPYVCSLVRVWKNAKWRCACCIRDAQTGTFLYTFAGTGATAAFVLGNILKISGLGSAYSFIVTLEMQFLSKGIWRIVGLLQVGIAYAVGIALALAVCAVRRAESASHSVRMGIEMFDIHRAFQGVILAQALLSMPSFCGGSPLERP